MTIKIICGDCLDVMRKLPADSVDCVVTSPPYFGLRDYGVDGQIGLEASPAEYIETLVECMREVRRILRSTGTAWVNLGDSYAGAGRGSEGDKSGLEGSRHNQRESRTALIASRRRDDEPIPRSDRKHAGYKTKDLMMMPARVAIALQEDGWYLRQEIIWSKPNPMPESVTDRCTKAHEYIYLLSKSVRYHYDADAIAEPLAESSIARLRQDIASQEGSPVPGKTNGMMKAVASSKYMEDGQVIEGYETKAGISGPKWQDTLARSVERGMRNKRSVWEITTKGFGDAHFATFPPELPETCIKAGCPEVVYICDKCGGTCTTDVFNKGGPCACGGDFYSRPGVVLDFFGGAATTALVAHRLQRDAISIELNPEYARMGYERIRADAPLLSGDVVYMSEGLTEYNHPEEATP